MSFFGLGRKKVTTQQPTTGKQQTTQQIQSSLSNTTFSSYENLGPAAKVVAVEKPGQAQPARGFLHDITNANRTGQQQQGPVKGHSVLGLSQRASSTATLNGIGNRRPDIVVHQVHQQLQTTNSIPTLSQNIPNIGIVEPMAVDQILQGQQSIQQQQQTVVIPSLPTLPTTVIDLTTQPTNQKQVGQVVSSVAIANVNGNIEDIDELDHDDPMFCSEYVNEIYAYLRQKEITDRINSTYMSRHRHISEKMRSVIIDWLVETHLKLRLMTETLFLTVNIMDKFLERRAIQSEQFQLLGVTALLIASKVEETYCLEAGDLAALSDKLFTRQDIVNWERNILSTIDWQISSPTPLHFLRRFSKAAKNDGQMHTLSKYIIEFSLLDYGCIKYLPSQLAAGACYLSRRMLHAPPYWTNVLEFYSGYKEAEVIPIARELNALISGTISMKFHSVKKKYSSSKLGSVAKIPSITEPF